MILVEIAPLLLGVLDNGNPQAVQRTLRIIPQICEMMDYSTVKNNLFPRISLLYLNVKNLAIRVNILVCFHSLLKVIDKFTMVEKLIPLLKEGRVRHHTVYLAMLAIYDEMGRNYLDTEVVATEILPELWRLAVDTVLNVDQFRKLMTTIHDLGDKVEQTQLR